MPGSGETRTAGLAAGMPRHSLSLRLGLQFSTPQALLEVTTGTSAFMS